MPCLSLAFLLMSCKHWQPCRYLAQPTGPYQNDYSSRPCSQPPYQLNELLYVFVLVGQAVPDVF